MLFAQTAPGIDPFGGWGSLILQGGAFMLLAYVVVVLFPKMLKEFREEREHRDANFTAALESLEQRFNARNAVIVAAIEKQTVQFSSAMGDSSVRIERAVTSACRANLRPMP